MATSSITQLLNSTNVSEDSLRKSSFDSLPRNLLLIILGLAKYQQVTKIVNREWRHFSTQSLLLEKDPHLYEKLVVRLPPALKEKTKVHALQKNVPGTLSLPDICASHRIEHLLSEGYTIRKITLRIKCDPLVREQGQLACYKQYQTEYTSKFYNGYFDRGVYLAKVSNVFKEFQEKILEQNSYANIAYLKITCQATIESDRSVTSNEFTDTFTNTITYSTSKYLQID